LGANARTEDPMKRFVPTTGQPHGDTGFGARSRWCASPASGLDRQWAISAYLMTAKQANPAAGRPMGFAGGGYR
jgi:hypothetical protein